MLNKTKEPISVIITDTHLDEDNFDVVFDKFKQAISLAKDKGLKHVFHLGDHFHTRASQRLRTLLSFRAIIKLFEEEKITLITFAGNHDKTDQSKFDSYLDIYKSDNFVNVNTDEQCLVKQYETGDTHFYCLPYFVDDLYNEKLKKICDNLDLTKKNVLLTHIGIDGVLNNDGLRHGCVIDAGKFQNFDLILIGHYHNYNKVSNKIVYIGSTDPRTYGEDSNKGATILYSDLKIERSKFDFPEFIKIQITNFDSIELNNLIQQNKNSNNNIRFEFIGNELDFLKIDKKLIESNGISVTTVNTSIIETEVEDEKSINVSMDKSEILKHFVDYCKQEKIDNKKSSKILKYF